MTAFGRLNRKVFYIAVAMLALAVTAAGSVGITQARYNKSDISSVVYGGADTEASTVSAEGTIYDFGNWQIGNGDGFSSTVKIESPTALNGIIRFVLDSETRNSSDIAVQVDSLAGANGEYTVNEPDGKLEVPFELFFSPTNRVANAYLDVEWIPSGENKAKLSARYLMNLNTLSEEDSGTVDFDQNNTKFLSNDLLKLGVSFSQSAKGLFLAPGSSITNKFSVGTKYYTPQYPQGVTLLYKSLIYIPNSNEGKIETVLDLGDYTKDKPINITAGISENKYAVTSQTPLSDSSTVILSTESNPILSHTSPLIINLNETVALRDDEWNVEGSSEAELNWQIERLTDEGYVAVETGRNLTVSASQEKDGGTLVLSAPTGDQRAGTYRLRVTQSYNNYIVNKSFLWFFIDYR